MADIVVAESFLVQVADHGGQRVPHGWAIREDPGPPGGCSNIRQNRFFQRTLAPRMRARLFYKFIVPVNSAALPGAACTVTGLPTAGSTHQQISRVLSKHADCISKCQLLKSNLIPALNSIHGVLAL